MKAEWRMKDSRSGEKCLRELDLNIYIYLTLNYVRLQSTLNTVHENLMVFYNVFVAFVGLNNNTILSMQNISSDQYPDPAENASIEVIPILNIGSAHP